MNIFLFFYLLGLLGAFSYQATGIILKAIEVK